MISKLPNKFKPEEDLKNKVMELDKAYIPTRYPNAIPEGAPYEVYSRNEAERLILYAEEIINFCKNLQRKLGRKPVF